MGKHETNRLKLEIEFFSLAGIMLACLQRELLSTTAQERLFALLGYMDFASEMGLVIKEIKQL